MTNRYGGNVVKTRGIQVIPVCSHTCQLVPVGVPDYMVT